jgi:hypothetical protein
MKAPCVTLSTEELMACAPEVRQKLHKAVTPKRVTFIDKETTSNNMYQEPNDALPFHNIEELISPAILTNSIPPPGAAIVPDPFEAYLNSLAPGELAQQIIVAKELHSLHSIKMDIGEGSSVEGILDGGCQIISMSKAVCHHLHLNYDPTIILHMESANGTVDPSLGLTQNVPCSIGDITLYLQIHVIRQPAYDILLGRPFNVLTHSTTQDFANEDQTITIRDPNSRRVVTIPTVLWSPPKFCMNLQLANNGKSKKDF